MFALFGLAYIKVVGGLSPVSYVASKHQGSLISTVSRKMQTKVSASLYVFWRLYTFNKFILA